MIHRGLVILFLGLATIAQSSTRISFAVAAFGRFRIMPTATRRQRLSPARVASSLVSKENDKKMNTGVVPPKTCSSLFATPPTPVSSSSLSTTSDTDSFALLQTWANHSHADYHNFTDTEAIQIRSALLEWYAAKRRKLPWRGDPPPFDGSTSGINSNANKKRARNETTKSGNKKSKPSDQKSITSFFSAKSAKSKQKIKSESPEPNQPEESKKSESSLDQAIPVTGYGVWVSEIMLQQTRVEAVIPFWIKWMKSFPTVYVLAAATEDEVNAHWAGLGFYRRARYLHQGAKYVVEELDGKLPTTPQGLSKIAGIGPYTASAISSIAYGVCVPVVDGNVCRVLSRLKGIANHIKAPILKDKLGWKLAAQIVEAGDGSSPGLVNQALMELGATYCAPAGSGIDERDPLRDYYLSTKLGRAYLDVLQKDGVDLCDRICLPDTKSTKKEYCELCDPNGISIVLKKLRESIVANETTMDEAAKIGHSAFPTDPPKTEKREEDLAMAVLRSENRYLMVKRPKKGLLAGQWEFPNVCVQIRKKKATKVPGKSARGKALTKFLSNELFLDHPDEEICTNVPSITRLAEKDPLEHIFSHVKHYMWVEVGELTGVDLANLEWTTPSGKEVRWMNKDDMQKVGITSGVKKVLQFVEKPSAKSKSKKRKT